MPLNNLNDPIVQENAHKRQEALKAFSKQARHRLEEAKQNERVYMGMHSGCELG